MGKNAFKENMRLNQLQNRHYLDQLIRQINNKQFAKQQKDGPK